MRTHHGQEYRAHLIVVLLRFRVKLDQDLALDVSYATLIRANEPACLDDTCGDLVHETS